VDLRICVPRGALFEESVEALSAAGLPIEPLVNLGRKLIVECPGGPTYITTRPSDVPVYVESGAADLGIVGLDVLLERKPDVYELLDLGFGGCRMVWATQAGDDPAPAAIERFGVVRVATKYVNCAREHFANKGVHIDTIQLYGSMELAPLVGLADAIVDLVSTGNTLKANGLVEVEAIADISARLVVNQASYKRKRAQLQPFFEQLK
jgi:ATP phosphoribosyltransferase